MKRNCKQIVVSGSLLVSIFLVSFGIGAAEIVVKSGQAIQDAVTRAKAGDTILVEPGIYKETVYIDKNNITLRGVIRASQWPTLEGEKIRNDAVLYSGSGITVENLKIVNYKGNGIMGQAGNNFVIRNNWIIDAGIYGIFPEFGKNGLIEHNVLSGIEDAAIYVGMCDNVDVLHNEVFDSVAGIEIENSRHQIVDGNYVHDNTGGILAFITPGLPIKTAYDIIIRNNFVVNNNHVNFAIPGSIVSFVAKGTGITIMAADDVVVENNIITDNEFIGIGIAGLEFISAVRSDPDSEPNADGVKILNNLMWNNGTKALPQVMEPLKVAMPGVKGVDIANLGQGKGGCILEKDRYVSVGLDNYSKCELTSTAATLTYTLPEPVPIRQIAADEKGKAAYFGICAGCHAYAVKMIGPPTVVVKALYKGRPEALAEYIANPVKKRPDYPEMPPQNYISPEVRLEVAKYMLSVEK